MPNICIVDESNFPQADRDLILAGAQDFLKEIAPHYNFGVTVSLGLPKPGDWPLFITTRARHSGAAGYHGITVGTPLGFVLPGTVPNRFGTFRKAVMATKFRKAVAEYRLLGTLGVLCHEMIEMLYDPAVKKASEEYDSKGRHWLMEIADPVAKDSYAKIVNGKMMIFPDFVYADQFYSLKGKAPFDRTGVLTAPFTLSKGGYAYELKADGSLTPIVG